MKENKKRTEIYLDNLFSGLIFIAVVVTFTTEFVNTFGVPNGVVISFLSFSIGWTLYIIFDYLKKKERDKKWIKKKWRKK